MIENIFFADGYNAVALTTEFTDSHFHIDGQKKEKHKKQAKEISKVFPPINTVQFEDLNLKIYTRANILVNDPNTFQKITQSKVLKQYDIVAYLPGNSQILKQLANITDYDILCFNPLIHNERLNLNRKLYNQFVQNGIYMELPYSPTISDSSLRKYIIMMAHIYHAVGKSSNIIISSGGSDFRAPYDVINLYPFICKIIENERFFFYNVLT